MTENVTDIATLDELKEELRISPDEDDQTNYLERLLASAVDIVERKTGRALMDRETELLAERKEQWGMWGGKAPIVFTMSDFMEMVSVKYWGVDDDITAPPAQEIPVGDLRRIEFRRYSYQVRLWPPAAGWPVTNAQEHRFQITAKQGMKFKDDEDKRIQVKASLTQAVLMVAQKLYDGEDDYHVVDGLLRTWTRYD